LWEAEEKEKQRLKKEQTRREQLNKEKNVNKINNTK
jgi:hypothetical protein